MLFRNKTIKPPDQYRITLPGEIFTKHIKFGTPEMDGVYVCLYKHEPGLAHDCFPPAGMKIAHYSQGKWGCSDMVLAFLGPLPILCLDQLTMEKECVNVQFTIGTLKQAARNKFKSVHYPQYILATLEAAHNIEGNFIFEMNSHKTMPIPVAKLTESGQWEKIPDPKKYIKIIKMFRDKANETKN